MAPDSKSPKADPALTKEATAKTKSAAGEAVAKAESGDAVAKAGGGEAVAKADGGEAVAKADGGEAVAKAGGGDTAAAPSNYSRGEGQKPVTAAYKENWNAIFAKKSAKKKAKKNKR